MLLISLPHLLSPPCPDHDWSESRPVLYCVVMTCANYRWPYQILGMGNVNRLGGEGEAGHQVTRPASLLFLSLFNLLEDQWDCEENLYAKNGKQCVFSFMYLKLKVGSLLEVPRVHQYFFIWSAFYNIILKIVLFPTFSYLMKCVSMSNVHLMGVSHHVVLLYYPMDGSV